jgi:hypothetical protein
VNNERPIYITLLLVLATLAFCSAFATAHTHDDVCDVVQASFVTLTKSQDPVYPRDIEPSSGSTMLEGIQTSSGSIMLKGIGSSPLAKMELREDEVSDLISQQAKYSRDHFLPECDWKGNAQPMAFGSTVVKFSNPIFPQIHNQQIRSQCGWRPRAYLRFAKGRFRLARTVLDDLDPIASRTWCPKR